MLAKLFGSAARVRILKLFLLNPDTSYYIREISRHLTLQLSAVRRELENLETLGILTSHQGEEDDAAPGKNDRKYFQTNKNFILYSEIRDLILKSQILCEKEFTQKLRKLGTIKLLVISGVFLNEKEAPVDMMIVGDFNKDKVSKLVKELEAELVNEVNYAVLTEEEFYYRRQVTDVFLYSVLESPKIVIIDEGGHLNIT